MNRHPTPLIALLAASVALLVSCRCARNGAGSAMDPTMDGAVFERLHPVIETTRYSDCIFGCRQIEHPDRTWDAWSEVVRSLSFRGHKGTEPLPPWGGDDLLDALMGAASTVDVDSAVKSATEAWMVAWIGGGHTVELAGYVLMDDAGRSWFVWTRAVSAGAPTGSASSGEVRLEKREAAWSYLFRDVRDFELWSAYVAYGMERAVPLMHAPRSSSH